MLAADLLAIASQRGPRKPRNPPKMRCGRRPIGGASAAAISRSVDEAVKGAADMVPNGSRQQIVGTIAVAALIGWVLGRQP